MLDVPFTRGSPEVWDIDWQPRYCLPDEPPISSLAAKTPGVEWSPRVIAPVVFGGLPVAILDVQVDDDPASKPVLKAIGTISHLLHEVTHRERANRLFSTTFDSAPTGQLLLDENGVIQAANEAIRKLGVGEVGQPWTDVDPTFRPDRPEYEFRVMLGRHVRWIRVRSSTITVGELRPITVVHVEDTTSQRASQAILEYDATHDQMTGLGNRRLLDDRLTTAVREGAATVIMVDVDRFKVINDSLGHSAGDAVLLALADRLRMTVRGDDLVCRFGGDEFSILVSGERERHELVGLASRLLEVLRERVEVDGFTVIPTCSLGIATAIQGEDPETVLRHADAALGTAKKAGRDCYAFFDPQDTEALRNRLALEMGIRAGIERREFFPWFQPEYSLDTGRVIGLEALVRWKQPGAGVVPAFTFIDVAEEIGLAPAMSELVLERSCELARGWHDAGHEVKVRVNITAAQLQNENLEFDVVAALQRHQLSPEMLCLEVTERSLLLDVEQAIDTLGRIRNEGIEVAVDDFGTGFSSLAWLKRLPVDILKIDRAFVQGVARDRADREIVRTIIGLARALDLEVVAEGVEDPSQVTVLQELGCRRAQGWLWSPAVDPFEVPALLASPAEMPAHPEK